MLNLYILTLLVATLIIHSFILLLSDLPHPEFCKNWEDDCTTLDSYTRYFFNEQDN